MNKVIVTGGTGFIGFRLIKELLEHSIEVIALVRDSSDLIQFKSLARKEHLRIIQYFSSEFQALNETEEIDVFYHLAWAGVTSAQKNDIQIQLENINFSIKMLEYAKRIGVKRFIGTGTVAEYAFSEKVIEANCVRQTPNDIYAAAKTSTYYILGTYARMLEIPFNWVVLSSTFGEGRRNDNIITYTIIMLLHGEKPQYGELTQMWDFIYVGEAVRALCLIGEKGHFEKTYGIGSGDYRQLKDFIFEIRDIINPDLELGIGMLPSLSGRALSSCVNIYELVKDTGFKPMVTFEEGIRRTIPSYN